MKPIDGSSDPSYDPLNNPGIIHQAWWKQSKVVDQTLINNSGTWPIRFWSNDKTTWPEDIILIQANMLN